MIYIRTIRTRFYNYSWLTIVDFITITTELWFIMGNITIDYTIDYSWWLYDQLLAGGTSPYTDFTTTSWLKKQLGQAKPGNGNGRFFGL